MIEVRREDGELTGFVEESGGSARALSVFGGELAVCATVDDATDVVLATGLASLIEPWWQPHDGEWRRVWLHEASPGRVVVRLGPYPDPDEPPLDLRGQHAAALLQRLP